MTKLRNEMTNKVTPTSTNNSPWKNEFSRQRWELFHRAIAHAKQSNVARLDDADSDDATSRRSAPVLYVAK
jgi:hypothetical protein